MDMKLGTGYGEPVRSLQTFLREVAQFYTVIPIVVPDGIFGTQTLAAVAGFQSTFGLQATGEVDNATWGRLIAVYDEVIAHTREPEHIKIFPTARTVITPGMQSEHLYAIQGVLQAVSHRLPSLGSLTVTGIHDEPSVNVVKNVQAASGLPPTGLLDLPVWCSILRLYEAFVSRNRLETIV